MRLNYEKKKNKIKIKTLRYKKLSINRLIKKT